MALFSVSSCTLSQTASTPLPRSFSHNNVLVLVELNAHSCIVCHHGSVNHQPVCLVDEHAGGEKGGEEEGGGEREVRNVGE